MTNEEAKDVLIMMRDNCLSKRDYEDPMRGIKHHALTMAISAIENQPKWQQALNNACCDIDGLVSEMRCEPHWIQRRKVSDYMEDAGIEVSDDENERW